MPQLPPVVRRAVVEALVPRPLSLFLLGAVGGLAAFAGALWLAYLSTGHIGASGLDGRLARQALGWTVTMAAGYATALHLLLPTLRADAEVAGRRSATIGAVAAGAFLIACLLLGPVGERARLAAAALCGAGSGALVLWPWRLRRAERQAARALEPA